LNMRGIVAPGLLYSRQTILAIEQQLGSAK